jgi:hypothetical protein
LVFLAIWAIRPRLCSVHIQSLNHKSLHRKTPTPRFSKRTLIDQEEQQAEKDETDEARLERAERTAAMREVLPGFLRDFRNLICASIATSGCWDAKER